MKFANTLWSAALALVVATTTAATTTRKHPDSAPALNDKGALRRVVSQVAKKHDAYIKQEVVCSDTQETCFDEDYNPVSCGDVAEGGCTCPEGLTKCNPMIDPWLAGLLVCRNVCCDDYTEETCYDENGYSESCAPFEEGGCDPCPEGEVKCGGENPSRGYCTTVCCDDDTEETCTDEDGYTNLSCAPIAEGGCPCPEGQVKCDTDEENNDPGWCNDVCCDDYCWDDNNNSNSACCLYDDDDGIIDDDDDDNYPTNEFPSNARSYDMQKNHMAMLIQTKGTRKEISYFHYLNMQQKKLLANGKSNVNSDKLALKQKEAKHFHTIKLREGNPSAKNGASL